MLLLFISMQLPAMQAARNFIRQKPLTTMIATAATAGGLTYASMQSHKWQSNLKLKPIKKAIAQDHAYMRMVPSDR